MRVLAADDDPLMRHLLQHILSQSGYEVVTACDGNQAWQILCGPQMPPLMILDWMMPGLSGLEICRRLRRGHARPYSYILMLTAATEPSDLIAGLDAGADDYLFKPFQAAELKARLHAGRRIVEQHERLHEPGTAGV